MMASLAHEIIVKKHPDADNRYIDELANLIIEYIAQTRNIRIANDGKWWRVLANHDTKLSYNWVEIKVTPSLHVAVDFALQQPVIKTYTAGEQIEGE